MSENYHVFIEKSENKCNIAMGEPMFIIAQLFNISIDYMDRKKLHPLALTHENLIEIYQNAYVFKITKELKEKFFTKEEEKLTFNINDEKARDMIGEMLLKSERLDPVSFVKDTAVSKINNKDKKKTVIDFLEHKKECMKNGNCEICSDKKECNNTVNNILDELEAKSGKKIWDNIPPEEIIKVTKIMRGSSMSDKENEMYETGVFAIIDKSCKSSPAKPSIMISVFPNLKAAVEMLRVLIEEYPPHVLKNLTKNITILRLEDDFAKRTFKYSSDKEKIRVKDINLYNIKNNLGNDNIISGSYLIPYDNYDAAEIEKIFIKHGFKTDFAFGTEEEYKQIFRDNKHFH